ncbi:vomeronasal type-2 receptor 26-like [Pelodytes ibericus]
MLASCAPAKISTTNIRSSAQVIEGDSGISYGAMDNKLSDRLIYPHFFRTLETDNVYYMIITKIVKDLGWTWVGILASNDDTGETESQLLSYIFTNKTIIFPPSWASNYFLTDIYVEAFNGSLALEFVPLIIPNTGSFFDDIHPSKRVKDKLLADIWMSQFKCSSLDPEKNELYSLIYGFPLHNCTGKDNAMYVKDHMTNGVTPRVFNSVTSMAFAIHNMYLNLKRTPEANVRDIPNYRHQLYRYIKEIEVIFPSGQKTLYNEYGEYVYNYLIFNWIALLNRSAYRNVVGTFTEWAPEGQQLKIEKKSIIWRNKNNQIPTSQCSENCLPGYRKVQRPGIHSCCYDCTHCPEGEISNTSDSENCVACPTTEWPNERKDQCIPRLEEFLSYNNDAVAVVFSFVSLLCCLLTLVILIIFLVFRNTPIVKANNKNLSFILLVSIMLSFLCVFLFLGRPVDITCMLRQMIFSALFSIAMSCVLGKTVMVYIVFKATKPDSFWRRCIGVKLSNMFVVMFSFIQVIINIIWLIISPPFQEMDTQSYPGKMIIQCNEGSVIAFYSVLGYMGFLAAVSFIIAFLARTLPDSFNEAKYITFSMLVFFSVWIAMIPAYLSTKGKAMVAVEIFSIIASNSGVLGCIFIPKCYIILFHPEINTKNVFA